MDAICKKAGRLSDKFVDEIDFPIPSGNFYGSAETVYNECGFKSIEFSQASGEVDRGRDITNLNASSKLAIGVCKQIVQLSDCKAELPMTEEKSVG